MPIDVSDFRANLPGGGARPNLFEVSFNEPAALSDRNNKVTKLGEAGSFLVKATSLPATTVTRVDIPFRGRNIRVPGVREFDDTWVTTVMNDTDFGVRRWCEEWMDKIASHESNVGNFTLTDLAAEFSVYQLDHRDGARIRGYVFKDMWPSELGAIDLDASTNDSIEEFDVTWAYSYWMVDEGNELKDAVAGPSSSAKTVS